MHHPGGVGEPSEHEWLHGTTDVAPSLGTHLRRGAVAGLLGGAASSVVLALIGERVISSAIRFEESAGTGGEELLGRRTQIVGGIVAMLLVGAAVGVVFAVTFAAARSVCRGGPTGSAV